MRTRSGGRGVWWRSIGAALAGFLAYGGWAYWVNSDHSQTMGWRAGLLQGTYSFVLTLLTTLLMERLYRTFARGRHPVYATVFATGALLFVTPCAIHALAGTPEILMTILPGFVIGMVYTTLYTLSLDRIIAPTTSQPPFRS